MREKKLKFFYKINIINGSRLNKKDAEKKLIIKNTCFLVLLFVLCQYSWEREKKKNKQK